MARILVMVVLIAGCIDQNLTPCGTLSCPTGSQCVGGQLCATADELAACTGLPDNATCQSATATGYCTLGVCRANICGDGVVTGNEVCDGSDVLVTCADLGYYEGTPSCTSSCTIEHTGCSGRCGDGIVQGDQGELCDGGPPVQTCTDFGRDYGALGCDRFCGPAILGDCGTYGWEVLLPAQPGVMLDSAAINSHGAIAIDDKLVRVLWDNDTTARANPGWTQADADAGTFVAAGAMSLGWFDGTWHDVAAGLAGAIVVQGGVVYGVAGDCTVSSIVLASGVVTSQPAPAGDNCGTPLVANDHVFVTNDGGLWEWNGAAWHQPVVAAGIGAVLRGPAGTLWLGGPFGSSFQVFDPATEAITGTVSFSDQAGQGFFIDRDGDVIASNSSPGGTSLSLYLDGNLVELSRIPEGTRPFLPELLEQVADGTMMAANGGVYRLGPTGGQVGIASALSDVSAINVFDDGAVAFCGFQIGWLGLTFDRNFQSTSWSGQCLALVGDPRSEHLVGALDGIYHYIQNGGTGSGSDVYSYHLELAGRTDMITGSPDDAWAMTAGVGLVHGTGGVWTPVDAPSSCGIAGISGGGSVPLFVLAQCGGSFTIFRRDDSDWTQIATTTAVLTQIVVAPDGAVFVTGDETARIDGDQLTQLGPPSFHVVPLAAQDVYIDLGTGVFSHVQNGIASTIRMPTGQLAVAPNALYVWSFTTNSLFGVTRMPLSDPGRGL